ncbi:MAG: TrkH family potassium uptake protein [Alphaproteobacteria bacterium]
MKFQIVGYTLGVLITIVGLAEMVPALVDWRYGHDNFETFFFNGIICLFLGVGLILANRSSGAHVNVRQAFLLTVSSWFLVSVFCALPLYTSDLGLSYVDAFFEAASGVTTTGASVLSGLDEVSRGILVWRSMMQWVGGLGAVAFTVLLLPYLKVGGMQIFRSAAAGQAGKVMPRSTEILGSMVKVYLGITVLCIFVYKALGMSWFDALNHAMTSISTGGFSTHDGSLGYFDNPALHYAAVFFMLAGAMPFVLYMRMIFQKRFVFFNDEQVRALLLGLCVLVFTLTLWLWIDTPYSLGTSFRTVLFSAVSIITTTGYSITDYTAWGGFAVLVFLLLSYLGGCAGSSAGGVKVMRLVISAKVTARQFKTLLYPNGVFVLNYQGRRLDGYTVLSVLGFLGLYVVANVVMTVALAFTGLDFETALSGAASALGNVGPGIGPMIGPGGNYAALPEAAKWILSLGMIAGRLEILTILVLLFPSYWKP